jgi:hypothetical protein
MKKRNNQKPVMVRLPAERQRVERLATVLELATALQEVLAQV